jgi:outer membrane protein insertion porin family
MVKGRRTRLKIILLLFGFAGLIPETSAQVTPRLTIERIDIRGNRRIQEDTIRFYIQSRPGEPYDEGRLELDLRALYKANFFENIEIEERDGDSGKIVTFTVKEKPLIRSINYQGNKSFTESNILDHFKEKKVGLTVDSQYDPSKIRAAERALVDLMTQNGKPLGTVRTEVESIPPSSVRVRFVMNEGAKVRIGELKFVGNKVFKDSELRKALKLTKVRGLMSIFKGTDKYHPGKLEADIEMNLKAFYKEHGYWQVQVGTPILRIFEGPQGSLPIFRKTKQQFYVELPIDAGDQYRLGELTLKDCGVLKCEALVNAFGLNKGDVVNFKKIKDTLDNIKKLYGNMGYINWSYLPEQNFKPDKTIDLTFTLVPDIQYTVHRINFSGNTKTRDKIMRREFILEEGRTFSTYALEMSVLRLNQLGFFDKIEEKDYEVRPDEKTGQVDVNIKVKEKSAQSIGLQGGVSGISGSFIGINYTTNNFRGRGETLEVSVISGTRTTSFTVSFTEPYLLDTRWTMGLSVFNTRYRYDTYTVYGRVEYTSSGATSEPTALFTQHITGATLTASRPLGQSFWRLGESYTFQKIGISDIAAGYRSFALANIASFAPNNDSKKALNGIFRSEITSTASYNTTNDYFNPSRGTNLNLSLGVAGGILGGDFNVIRPSIEYRHFLRDRWITHGRNILAFRILGEYMQTYGDTQSIPFFERLFIGGETTIRGFDIRSVSPFAIFSTPQLDATGTTPILDGKTGLTKVTRSIQSVGGDTMVVFNGEYRMPIAGPLTAALFCDTGMSRIQNVSALGQHGKTTVSVVDFTNNALRSSTGVEFQFLLPVVHAPFRLIFAYNPLHLDGKVYAGTVPYQLREPRHDIKFTIGRSF